MTQSVDIAVNVFQCFRHDFHSCDPVVVILNINLSHLRQNEILKRERKPSYRRNNTVISIGASGIYNMVPLGNRDILCCPEAFLC